VIFQFQQAVRALILFAFSGLIFKLHITGDITKLINPKYVGLSQSAFVIFVILFFIQITRIWTKKESNHIHCHHDDHACNHDHGNSNFNIRKLVSYMIIVFPLVTGFLLPAKVLDASIASKKGGMAVLTGQKESSKFESNVNSSETIPDITYNESEEYTIDDNPVDPGLIKSQKEISKDEFNQLIQKLEQNANIEMEDFVYNAYYEEISKDINKFKGRHIALKGFVYKEDGMQQNQLVLSRFLITHCVADASIIGFLSEITDASSIDEDTWVEAKGVLDVTSYNGLELPYIKITDWKKISEPDEPYLYPISIKIL
jgi:putative membrane protein